MRRGRFFGAGEVRIAILSLLSEKPRHGYELMKELETRSGGSYRVSAGTMYPALQQLEDEGMIVSATTDGKRVYQLTDLGKQELERERATADNIWRRTSDWSDWGDVGQWMSVVGPFMKTAIRAMRDGARDPEKRKKIEEILERARKDLESV
jgi:DNA-binding PadR family transcriptional regulator